MISNYIIIYRAIGAPVYGNNVVDGIDVRDKCTMKFEMVKLLIP